MFVMMSVLAVFRFVPTFRDDLASGKCWCQPLCEDGEEELALDRDAVNPALQMV